MVVPCQEGMDVSVLLIATDMVSGSEWFQPLRRADNGISRKFEGRCSSRRPPQPVLEQCFFE